MYHNNIEYVTTVPVLLSLITYCGGMEDSKKESIIPTLVYLRKALSPQMLEVCTVFLKA
jgi:hypothetical protein